jgi:hypothetical protein
MENIIDADITEEKIVHIEEKKEHVTNDKIKFIDKINKASFFLMLVAPVYWSIYGFDKAHEIATGEILVILFIVRALFHFGSGLLIRREVKKIKTAAGN